MTAAPGGVYNRAMSLFAIADLHLSTNGKKGMEVFGAHWAGHAEKIRARWFETVGPDDTVLVAGDISWELRFEEARLDLEWLAELPGTKILVRGNHDYWWASLSKVKQDLPASIIPLQNTAARFGEVGIAGSRLWIDPDLR
ncbi:MAG: metallophosphoesterase, partial [Armatimonadota bacterium]|nr:metallophosphoesterase [Armatimonadota bacterium]